MTPAPRRNVIKLHKTENYDIKKSKAIIGPLYPVLNSKDGKIIDGARAKRRLKNEG